MGVKNLWSILDSTKLTVSVKEMEGTKVAIDLSVWIVTSQSTKAMKGVVSKPHLRNLFFRTSMLLRLGVQPLFVIDGKAPAVKWETMSARLSQRGFKTSHSSRHNRCSFNRVIKECCQMLDLMGVPYIQAEGEAEALCAHLNQLQVVDAVITEDGDAFLYGATTVYRNFNISKPDSVEKYQMKDITDKLGFDRDALISLALFLGCDYLPKGVSGVGKAQALQLLEELRGEAILDRLRKWKTMGLSLMRSCERRLSAKALQESDFPNEEVIGEFQRAPQKLKQVAFSLKCPNLPKLQVFLHDSMEWVYEYTVSKVFPLITLYMMHGDPKGPVIIRPQRIIKTRVVKGLPSLEVEWEEMDHIKGEAPIDFVTIEPRVLFESTFPAMVARFTDDAAAKKSKPRNKKKQAATIDKEASPDTDLEIQFDKLQIATNSNDDFKDPPRYDDEDLSFNPLPLGLRLGTGGNNAGSNEDLPTNNIERQHKLPIHSVAAGQNIKSQTAGSVMSRDSAPRPVMETATAEPGLLSLTSDSEISLLSCSDANCESYNSSTNFPVANKPNGNTRTSRETYGVVNSTEPILLDTDTSDVSVFILDSSSDISLLQSACETPPLVHEKVTPSKLENSGDSINLLPHKESPLVHGQFNFHTSFLNSLSSPTDKDTYSESAQLPPAPQSPKKLDASPPQTYNLSMTSTPLPLKERLARRDVFIP